MVPPPLEVRRSVVGRSRLRRFFGPRSVAVVGASVTSDWTANLIRNLGRGAGLRNLTFVHPKHRELFGKPAIPSLRELTEPVDLAYVMVGPARVNEVLVDAAAAGVKNAVVLAAGYSETGPDGQRRQRELADLAVKLDITLMGPNTIGFINPVTGVSPWAVACPVPPLRGPIGAVFESGSMARATFEFAQGHAFGSSLWASVGNSAVMTSLDVLDYLVQDETTRAIALFLETVQEPELLLRLGREALEAGKPVVAYKAGRSAQGKRSAAAHTGAVATDDAIVDAALGQAGIVRVGSIEQMISTVGLFGYSPRLPAGRRMGVVTSSGGGCNIIADLAEENDIELPAWDEATAGRFRGLLPDFATVQNPLDTTGFGHARARPRPTKAEDDLMEIAVCDSGVDFVYNMMTPLPGEQPADPTFIESRMRIIGQMVAESPVPVFLSSNTCLDVSAYAHGLLADNGLYLLPVVNLAMASIGDLVRWTRGRDRILARPRPSVPAMRWERPGVTGTWAEDDGRDLLAAAGVPLVPARLARSAGEAARFAAEFGGLVAMKICSADIAHKSDAGGVALGVPPEHAAQTYTGMVASVATSRPGAVIRGVLVSPMRTGGQELLVGVTVDPTFGPVLAVGLGGVWVEALADLSLRVLPVDVTTVEEMLGELRGYSLLCGARGSLAADVPALAGTIVAISHAALALDALESVEVNPLRVRGTEIEALDVLVTTAGVS